MSATIATMPCPYCAGRATIVAGTAIYPHRPDLAGKRFWRCEPCEAYVGCHAGTENPLGRLANAELRMWKMRAHEAFDPLWSGETKQTSRRSAYRWLAWQLGIEPRRCHIGWFDVEQCKRVVEIVRASQGREIQDSRSRERGF